MSNKYKKIIFGMIVFIWMIIVFCFSNQPAKISTNTSESTIKAIINIFPNIRNMEENEKEQIVSNLQPIVRKLAHFSIYTLGGILIYNFIYTYDITNKRKMIVSFLIGGVYAITDELHQLFIPGRSCEIRDVCIDSSGVLLGICIIAIFIKLKTTNKETCKKSKNMIGCKNRTSYYKDDNFEKR